MDWFRQHADSLAVIAAIATSMIWMSGKFSDIEKDIGELRTEAAIIKTVLIMKQIMPVELAQHDKTVKQEQG